MIFDKSKSKIVRVIDFNSNYIYDSRESFAYGIRHFFQLASSIKLA